MEETKDIKILQNRETMIFAKNSTCLGFRINFTLDNTDNIKNRVTKALQVM